MPLFADVDGAQLEGGGQILRNAFTLAACARLAGLRVRRVRAGRAPKPGLRPQHAAGLAAVATLCGGQVRGGDVGSEEVDFTPGPAGPRATDAVVDTHTAGSVALLAQACLPCLLLAAAREDGKGRASSLDLRGGTDAAAAPAADYVAAVLLPTLRRVLGVDAALRVTRRGFFPRGGGRVVLAATALPAGATLPAFSLSRAPDDAVVSLRVTAVCAGRVKAAAATAAVEAAVAALAGVPLTPPGTEPSTSTTVDRDAVGDGGSILAVATTRDGLIFGSDAPLTRRDDAAAVGADVGRRLAADLASGAGVDEWLQDQVVVFAALAAGTSTFTTAGPPSLHTRTALAIAEQVVGAATEAVQEEGGEGLWRVTVRGVGVGAG
jgi:RNA 3'-terminal phosphate cyclase (ATP)